MVGYAQKRLASTAASVKRVSLSTAHLQKFPPKEALASSSSSSTTPSGAGKAAFFDAETYAALQPPPSSALAAFAHRVGLASLTTPELIQQACTHRSFLSLYSRHHPNRPLPATNTNLATLGNSLLGLFATEYVNATYPYLPTRVLKAAVSAYVGPTTCANVATEMGASPLLRWHRLPNTPTRPAVLHPDALSSVPRALTALVYQYRSLLSARKFAQKFFFSRELDLRNMIKFRDPKLALLETVAKFGRERPVSRLLKETGRFSNSPVYVVGIYSGGDQLGEGFGSSLKMAEFRAAEDALHRLYLTRQPSHLVQLPTSTFPEGTENIFKAQGAGATYAPGDFSDTEVLYGSSGRTGLLSPGRRARVEEDEDEI